MNTSEYFDYLENESINWEVEELASEVLRLPNFENWSGSAKPIHHHYGRGGLLQHTFEVVLYSTNVAFLHNLRAKKHTVNMTELYLSALFHDIGKMWDYEPSGEDYEEWKSTAHKRKIHHISRSALYFNECARKHNLDADLRDRITHNILSHHGCREWGSPVSPASGEAWLLHLADNISARLDDWHKHDRIDGK